MQNSQMQQQNTQIQELNMDELQQVNGGWFWGMVGGYIFGEEANDWRDNSSSYGSNYNHRDLMHAKY